MTAFWLVMWVEVRGRWRALASLALLLGLVGGVALGAAAGARRTDTAYPRLLASANASQLMLVPESDDRGGLNRFYAALARMPQAAAVAPLEYYNASLPPAHRATAGLPVQAISGPDGRYGATVDRVKLLAGQMFGPREPGAAVINQQLAGVEHLSPGDILRLAFVPANTVTGNEDLSKQVIKSFTVTGIAVFDNQIVSTGTNAGEPTALLSPPFAATAAQSIWCCDAVAVRLRPGADAAQFGAAATQLATKYPATGGQLDILNAADQVSATQRAIRPQAVALALFAGLTALIALAVLSQLLSRQLALDAAQYPTLRVLGVTRPALAAVSLARLALVSGAGALLAVVIAVAGSPLMPIGPARLADPSPGVSVDPLVLGGGFAAIALLPLAFLAPAAWRAAGTAGVHLRPGRSSAIGAALSRWGSVTGGIGVRMAFEPGRGSTAVPVRSALAGTMVAVGAIAGALVFGASLVGLVSTPHQYGQNWDVQLDLGFGAVPGSAAGQMLRADPALTGYTGGDYGLVSVNGTLVAAIGLDPPPGSAGSAGSGYVTVLAGRAPAGPDEIALGAKTMSTAHVQIGQHIPVVISHTARTGPPLKRSMRVVGEVILPAFSRGAFNPTDLGTGALLTASVLSEPLQAGGCPASGTCYNFFLVRYRPGTDEAAAAATLTTLATRAGCPPGACVVTSDQRPGDIRDYTYFRDTPLVLGALLVVLAVGTMAHVLLTGVRRRRRDLAVLKTLGLSRGQVLRLVAWQAGAFGFVALLAGLPLGVLAGRLAWAAFAAAAGIAPSPDIPLALIFLTIPATLLIAMFIAVWPGWRAARLRPAAVLWTG